MEEVVPTALASVSSGQESVALAVTQETSRPPSSAGPATASPRTEQAGKCLTQSDSSRPGCMSHLSSLVRPELISRCRHIPEASPPFR